MHIYLAIILQVKMIQHKEIYIHKVDDNEANCILASIDSKPNMTL